MIHLSSYHSNGLPTVVWPNKVNLIGEKVYKPKIHFCEHCNKPILIYGRLIPCKHVFCFTCATLCLATQPTINNNGLKPSNSLTPPLPGPSEPMMSSISNQSNHNSSDQSNMDESNSIATPDALASPILNGTGGIAQQQNQFFIKGCHRCGGKALRVERNTLNSIFVCQLDSCRRTYLSARDLQAHVAHRHSRHKSNNSAATTSASVAAISSSPYISSSSLLHLSSHNTPGSSSGNHRQSTSTNLNLNNNANSSNTPNNHNNSPINHHHKREREAQHNLAGSGSRDRERERERFRERDRERDRFMRARESYQRGRDRERDSKEYHRRSLQRAAQWAEASAQMLEKGLTR